jgi:hypothetical protein
MFGHQDDKKDDDKSSENDSTVAPDKPTEEVTDAGAADHTDEATHTDDTVSATDAATDTDNDTEITNTTPSTDIDDAKPAASNASEDDDAWQHPGTPLNDEDDKEDKNPAPINDIIGPNAGPDFKPFPQSDSDSRDDHADNTPHELIDIKQKALTDLTPLVNQLDQSPEDKFRTMMMMIQASDDQSLVKLAYDAAHKIKDEKARAQALLDIVNEINYFTQPPIQSE